MVKREVIIFSPCHINNSHGKLRSIMNSFICIIYDLQNRLVMIDFYSHGTYMIFIHQLYNSNTRKLFNKWDSNFDIGHFSWFDFMMGQREMGNNLFRKFTEQVLLFITLSSSNIFLTPRIKSILS